MGDVQEDHRDSILRQALGRWRDEHEARQLHQRRLTRAVAFCTRKFTARVHMLLVAWSSTAEIAQERRLTAERRYSHKLLEWKRAVLRALVR